MASYKNPPSFNAEGSYDAWRVEVQFWQSITDIAKRQQAAVVALSLPPRYKEVALTIPLDELNVDDGMDKLLAVLDENFKKESLDSAYEAFHELETFRRGDLSMTECILHFEKVCNKLKKHNMTLPDEIMGCKLLEVADLQTSQKQMVLSAVKSLKFADVRSVLKRIFTSMGASDDRCPVEVKSEALVSHSRGNLKRFRRNSYRESVGDTRFKQKRMNPKKDGHVTKCLHCGSIFHYLKFCPDKDVPKAPEQALEATVEEEPDPGEATSLVTVALSTNPNLLLETLGSGILDTGCTSTVCGSVWFDDFISRLPEKDRNIQTWPSTVSVMFGNFGQQQSIFRARLPCIIGGQPCTIDADVIEGNLPLLLSKASMKKASLTLWMGEDKATIFNIPLELKSTASGHYFIDLLPTKTKEVLLTKQKFISKQHLDKLHKQFGHCTASALSKLLSSANYTFEKKDIESLVENCHSCRFKKRTRPKPVVSLPISSTFNDIIAMDLSYLPDGSLFLHIICLFSRFCVAVTVPGKTSHSILNRFYKHWIMVFGPPKQAVLTDNGLEFDNQEFRDFCEKMGFHTLTTPSYSPFCNGVVERHNAVLKETFRKISGDFSDLDNDTRLGMCVYSHNNLLNTYGFTPSQIAFGFMPKSLELTSSSPPSWDTEGVSSYISSRLQAIHRAREAYLEAQSSEKVTRALKSNIRSPDGDFTIGDWVYYKRQSSWFGPCKVVAVDCRVHFLRNGARLIKAHSFDLMAADETDHNLGNAQISVSGGQEYAAFDTNDKDVEQNGQDLSSDTENDISDILPSDGCLIDNVERTSPKIQKQSTKVAMKDSKIGKKGDIVKFSDNGNDYVVEILSRAGKATGKNRNCFNIQYLDPTNEKPGWIDLSSVSNVARVDPGDGNKSDCLFIDDCSSPQIEEAKQREIQSWRENGVFREITDTGEESIDTRWVITFKSTNEGLVPKARLVARGFQDENLTKSQTESPVIGRSVIRLLISVAALNNWDIKSFDVKTAFLQSKSIQRRVLIKPPKEAMSKALWLLRKPVYGLADASKEWFLTAKREFILMGLQQCFVEPCLFYQNSGGDVMGAVIAHVDDFMCIGSGSWLDSISKKIKAVFNIGKENGLPLTFTGLEISRGSQNEILVDQRSFVEKLVPLPVEGKAQEALASDALQTFRSILGQLQWISGQSRPDIAFIANSLGCDLPNTTWDRVNLLNKAIRRAVFNKDVWLKFSNINSLDNLCILVYSDAAFQNLPDGSSQCGNIAGILDRMSGIFHPFHWGSRKCKRIARSTLAAETLRLSSALDEIIFFRDIFALFIGKKVEIVAIIDSKQLLDALNSSKMVQEFRLRAEIASLKAFAETEAVTYRWFPTNLQLADCLTKRSAIPNLLLKVLSKGKICLKEELPIEGL